MPPSKARKPELRRCFSNSGESFSDYPTSMISLCQEDKKLSRRSSFDPYIQTNRAQFFSEVLDLAVHFGVGLCLAKIRSTFR